MPDPKRNRWGYIFPEDGRCILVPELDDGEGGGGDGKELDEWEQERPHARPGLSLAD
jgi:hypothetical protein